MYLLSWFFDHNYPLRNHFLPLISCLSANSIFLDLSFQTIVVVAHLHEQCVTNMLNNMRKLEIDPKQGRTKTVGLRLTKKEHLAIRRFCKVKKVTMADLMRLLLNSVIQTIKK